VRCWGEGESEGLGFGFEDEGIEAHEDAEGGDIDEDTGTFFSIGDSCFVGTGVPVPHREGIAFAVAMAFLGAVDLFVGTVGGGIVHIKGRAEDAYGGASGLGSFAEETGRFVMDEVGGEGGQYAEDEDDFVAWLHEDRICLRI